MQLFSDYIHPLTVWLYDHPHWALLITFLISFSESLAIVGSIIPGSVTMTAIGILAGSGVMRIDLTLLAGALGAIMGDSASYALGYFFSHKLLFLWPFRKYPHWLQYGEQYFKKHGAKSVLLGRFIGPMRSIIPVIAGMMRMNQWQFLIANIISAVLWAILYITPGILIGAAGSELSAESATHLFALILVVLILIWFLSVGIRWSIIHGGHFLKIKLHNLWLMLGQTKTFNRFSYFLTPIGEVEHYRTACLVFCFILMLAISLLISILVIYGIWQVNIDSPIYLFFQSFRTHIFDAFFILMILLIHPLTLLCFVISVILYALYFQNWKLLRYWLSLLIISSIIIYALSNLIGVSKPINLAKNSTVPLFPEPSLTLATSLFLFFIFYLRFHYRIVFSTVIGLLLATLLIFAGIGCLYLGANWLSSILVSYTVGISICLLHWLSFRRKNLHQNNSFLLMSLCTLSIFIGGIASYPIFFKKNLTLYHPFQAQYVIKDFEWWNQDQESLPIYSTNRVGKPTGILNIQYAGSINNLKVTLEKNGWKRQKDSFFYSLLMRAGGKNTAEELPLTAQLYLNKKPTLMMVYSPKNSKSTLVLRLWRSNYHLQHYHEPIWIGSINFPAEYQKKHKTVPLHVLIHSLPGFQFKLRHFKHRLLKPLEFRRATPLLLIKSPAHFPFTH